ncbi:protein-L-isoaspartate O-methyltransferase [Lujinxingia litoralis]|uniref:Protein-L-isoaspartate O-methyltransferase n=1 Tax=Lujinxingia litoralis TaxID=2211119 RepID=A0A328CE30_9DELT|nr:protein-L-isoaspartate(D-aspartate) O-methyltransferase [Lujinxingia litoralis]RAL25359.1 protein-L-isoaspartate O-methyltransferase [Lujinxingia litoralis]
MSDPREERYERARKQMVIDQLFARGIEHEAVLEAMRQVPRERFVSRRYRDRAYADTALPIGHGQTISQPYVVAWMTVLLRPHHEDRVLEVGTGSGYQAAVLARLVAEVFTIERIDAVAEEARDTLAELGVDNVAVRSGDGSTGWAGVAPFDAVLVTAGGPAVPSPLLEQLRVGGRLVMPVGPEGQPQTLVRITRTSERRYRREEFGEVRFVPLIGEEGFETDSGRREPWF